MSAKSKSPVLDWLLYGLGQRFHAFKEAWKRSRRWKSSEPPGAPEIDAELHRARIDARGRKLTYDAAMNSLPNGCSVEIAGSAYLVWDEALLLWTPERYAEKHRRPNGITVTVLTPRPIVECLRHGYEPEIHESARAF